MKTLKLVNRMRAIRFTSVSLFLLMGLAWQPGYGQTANGGRGSEEIVAIVGDKRIITLKEVDVLLGRPLQELQERLYELRKNALENLITKLLLAEEAAAQEVTVEVLMRRLAPETVTVDADEVEQIYRENISGLGQMREDEARQRIRLDLESRKKVERYLLAIAELRRRAPVEILLPEPDTPALLVTQTGPAKGSAESLITIIEFSDFQCPYCKQARKSLEQLLASEPGVRLIFKHLPLAIHPQAFRAAQAAVCAAEQGRFWPYHDRLFDAADLSEAALQRHASEMGLNHRAFADCLQSENSRAAVLKDMEEAQQLNIQGTPTFVINGRLVTGAKDLAGFKQLIEELRKKQKK